MHRILRKIIHAKLRRDPRYLNCGCLIAAVEQLDGQHPWGCPNHTNRFGLGLAYFHQHPLEHKVDGVVMPWAARESSMLSSCWCDISRVGDGHDIARRFEETGHFAIAGRILDQWHWSLWDLALNIDGPHKPVLIAEGNEDNAGAVLEAVYAHETEYELAA